MSTAKHTPGPWAADGLRFVRQVAAPRHVICRLPHTNGQQDQSLIAAAPELLEALLDCRRALEIANFTQELAVVNAAIAKATGAPL